MSSRYSRDPGQRERTRAILRALSISAIVAAALAAKAQPDTAPPAASNAAPAPGSDDSEGSALLRQAREKLGSYRTLRAKMSETVAFGPRRFKAEGSYIQGPDNRVRVDLAVAIGENKGRLLQVSGGDVLWTVYDLGGKPRVTRRDINQILAAVGPSRDKAYQLAELGLGGLQALLASIEQSIAFEPPFEAEIEGRKFFVLQGEWKQEIRTAFQQQMQQAQPQQPPAGTVLPLPPHIPELVRLYLDAETLFPYRIRYLKRGATPGAEPTPLLTLDFRDIVVNASIDPSEFRYTPPSGVDVADVTSHYLQQLRGSTARPPGSQAGSAPGQAGASAPPSAPASK